MTTNEILSSLQTASAKVKDCKKTFDEASKKVTDASRDYESSKKLVIDLRKQLNKSLDDDLNGITDPADARGRISE